MENLLEPINPFFSEKHSFFITPKTQFEAIQHKFQRGWYSSYIEYIYEPGKGLTPVRRPYQQDANS